MRILERFTIVLTKKRRQKLKACMYALVLVGCLFGGISVLTASFGVSSGPLLWFSNVLLAFDGFFLLNLGVAFSSLFLIMAQKLHVQLKAFKSTVGKEESLEIKLSSFQKWRYSKLNPCFDNKMIKKLNEKISQLTSETVQMDVEHKRLLAKFDDPKFWLASGKPLSPFQKIELSKVKKLFKQSRPFLKMRAQDLWEIELFILPSIKKTLDRMKRYCEHVLQNPTWQGALVKNQYKKMHDLCDNKLKQIELFKDNLHHHLKARCFCWQALNKNQQCDDVLAYLALRIKKILPKSSLPKISQVTQTMNYDFKRKFIHVLKSKALIRDHSFKKRLQVKVSKPILSKEECLIRERKFDQKILILKKGILNSAFSSKKVDALSSKWHRFMARYQHKPIQWALIVWGGLMVIVGTSVCFGTTVSMVLMGLGVSCSVMLPVLYRCALRIHQYQQLPIDKKRFNCLQILDQLKSHQKFLTQVVYEGIVDIEHFDPKGLHRQWAIRLQALIQSKKQLETLSDLEKIGLNKQALKKWFSLIDEQICQLKSGYAQLAKQVLKRSLRIKSFIPKSQLQKTTQFHIKYGLNEEKPFTAEKRDNRSQVNHDTKVKVRALVEGRDTVDKQAFRALRLKAQQKLKWWLAHVNQFDRKKGLSKQEQDLLGHSWVMRTDHSNEQGNALEHILHQEGVLRSCPKGNLRQFIEYLRDKGYISRTILGLDLKIHKAMQKPQANNEKFLDNCFHQYLKVYKNRWQSPKPPVKTPCLSQAK